MVKTKDLAIDATAIGFAPYTMGLSLIASPSIQKFVKKFFGMNEEDDTSKKLEEWKIQNEQWKVQMEVNRAEVERLREERKRAEENIKKNDDEVARLRSIINNPHSSEEEKNNAKKRIVLLEVEINKLKERNKKLDSDIENKSKTPAPPSRPWSSYLPKLGFIDKVILASGVVLITYLIISKDKK